MPELERMMKSCKKLWDVCDSFYKFRASIRRQGEVHDDSGCVQFPWHELFLSVLESCIPAKYIEEVILQPRKMYEFTFEEPGGIKMVDAIRETGWMTAEEKDEAVQALREMVVDRYWVQWAAMDGLITALLLKLSNLRVLEVPYIVHGLASLGLLPLPKRRRGSFIHRHRF